nr:hypothetical protein [Gammaproteobacteria bacterium]
MMLGKLLVSFLFLTSATLLLANHPTAALAMSSEAQPTTRHLVIIGASYAGQWGTPQLPGYRITNQGVDGEESTQVRARFERDVIALAPDAVLIWGHYNDIVRAPAGQIEQAKARARDNYRAMIEQARVAGIEPILATEITLPIPDTWSETLKSWIAGLLGKQDYRAKINSHVKEVNEWLREFARAEKIQLLDLERAVDSGNGTRRLEYTQEDGSHISPAGYAAITEYVRTQLR